MEQLLSSCKRLLLTHSGALILAFGVGFICGVPQLLAEQALDDEYRRVPFLYQDNEAVYLSRIHEFADGHSAVSSPFLHEYKNDSETLMPPIGEEAYWLASRISRLDLTDIVVVSKFVLPALLFLLIYALVISVVPGARLAALAAASVSVLGFELVNITDMWALLSQEYVGTYLSIWTRLVHPISGGLALFGFLVAFRRALDRWLWAVLAALLLALSTTYIFAFGIAVAVVGVVSAAALITREWRVVWVAFGIGLGGAVIMAPYLWAGFASVGGGGTALALKNGLFLTRVPLMSTVVMGALVLGALTLLYERLVLKQQLSVTRPSVFLFLLVLGTILAMNQHVVTGRTVWPQHFVQYVFPIAYAAVIGWYALHAARFSKYSSIPLIGVIVISFALGISTIPTYRASLDQYRTENRYAPTLQFLRENEGPCVALSVERTELINLFVTAFTKCDAYYTHYTFMGVPDDRVRHNFFVQLRVLGITPDTVDAYFAEYPDLTWRVFFRSWSDYFQHATDPWLMAIRDEEEIEAWTARTEADVISEYKEFYKKDFRTELLKYRIDYVLWDKSGEVAFDAAEYPFLAPAFEAQGIEVYRVR